jgi:hypothetical protein
MQGTPWIRRWAASDPASGDGYVTPEDPIGSEGGIGCRICSTLSGLDGRRPA